MVAFVALNELTSRLQAAASGEEIGEALLGAAAHFGLTTALVVDVSKLFDRIGPALVFASAGRLAIETFDEERPFWSHPLVRYARENEAPFLMSWAREQSGAADDWWESLPPHVRRNDGLIVPVHDGDGLAWYTGFTGRDPDLRQRTFAVMGAASHAAYARFQSLLDASDPSSPLSPRQSECLRWIAQGKTDVETAKILGISPRTVRFHIDNAKHKLGVATRIQAVTKRLSGTA